MGAKQRRIMATAADERPWKIPPAISVCEMDFDHFKNRYGMDDKYHIIEVLRATHRTIDEIQDEWKKRREDINANDSKPLPAEENTASNPEWIQRVRIHSSIILGYFNHAIRNARWDTEKPRIFFSPFGAMIQYFPDMKQYFDTLEDRWGEVVRLEDAGEFQDALTEQKRIEGERESYRGRNKTRDQSEEDSGDDSLLSVDEYEERRRYGTENPIVRYRPPFEEVHERPPIRPPERSYSPPIRRQDTYSRRERRVLRRAPPSRDSFNSDSHPTQHIDSSDIIDPKLDNPVALRHMRCYIKFVEQRILPLEQKFRHLPSGSRVKSNDLWHLFQLGDIIHIPSKSLSQQQTSFVIWTKKLPPLRADYAADLDNRGLNIYYYYVDHDGENYGQVGELLTIEGYEGEREITDLPAYPLRYAHDYEEQHSGLRKHGEHFIIMSKEKHVYCQGWTLPNDPLGGSDRGIRGPIRDDYRSRTLPAPAPAPPPPPGYPYPPPAPPRIRRYREHREDYNPPEYVDSDVIIDVKEALSQNSHWNFMFGLSTIAEPGNEWRDEDDQIEIRHWSDGERTRLWASMTEKAQRFEDIRQDVMNRWQDEMCPAGPLDIIDGNGKIIRSALLVLPRRFFAYILRQRRFASVDVMTMEKIPPQETIFDDLQIDPNNKRMVKSLVASHFQKRDLQKNRLGTGFMNQDLIRGKGSGLFILLHGVPGVGKTATAEAVAQANGKPLFAITCGDLGFTPKEVEDELQRIFRLANLWDCVLLLDEADVFLARRDTWNLKRNALVSVFLRVLEYYSGILFLTTNRVGTMDEAFKSRIHVSLYYEPLTRDQTISIFRINIEKLRRIELEKEKKLGENDVQYSKLRIKAKGIVQWASNYFDAADGANESLRWNGRQIRNAFQIASSLAQYDASKVALEGDSVPGRILDESHFNLVAEAIEKFDTYMQYTTGMADSDHARIEGTRADGIRFSKEKTPETSRSSTAASSRKGATGLPKPTPTKPLNTGRNFMKSEAMPARNSANAVSNGRQASSRSNESVKAPRGQTGKSIVPPTSRSQAIASPNRSQTRAKPMPGKFGARLSDARQVKRPEQDHGGYINSSHRQPVQDFDDDEDIKMHNNNYEFEEQVEDIDDVDDEDDEDGNYGFS
ncbi:hypothetical protein GGI35DRAFT_454723 [Trichoderma velutinum]